MNFLEKTLYIYRYAINTSNLKEIIEALIDKNKNRLSKTSEADWFWGKTLLSDPLVAPKPNRFIDIRRSANTSLIN